MFLFYLQLGWAHIMSPDALDHQLFLAVLTIGYSFTKWRNVLVLITSFTIGHSLTLALSASNILFLPSYVIEILIPFTIVMASVEILVRRVFTLEITAKPKYGLAILFGLIHGLGFANVLRSMLGKEGSLILPLFGFNIGLELGQIVLAILFLTVIYLIAFLPKRSLQVYEIMISAIALVASCFMIFERI